MLKNNTEITVRGYHLDLYRHVNNARYLEFLEEARWNLLEKYLETAKESHLAFVIVNINIDYRRPATLGDILVIGTSLKRLGNKSLTLTQSINLKESGTAVARADVTMVAINTLTGESVTIDEQTRGLINYLPQQ